MTTKAAKRGAKRGKEIMFDPLRMERLRFLSVIICHVKGKSRTKAAE
jgi:hypothetical protein